MSLSEAAKEAYNNITKTIVYTIELRHPSFVAPIRVVRDRQKLTARLENDAPVQGGQLVDFEALAFELKLPAIKQNILPELTLRIDNIYLKADGKRISDYIDDAIGSLAQIELTCRIYVIDGADLPIEDPFHLILHSVTADSLIVTAKARFFNPQNEIFPRGNYTTEDFPTLAYE